MRVFFHGCRQPRRHETQSRNNLCERDKKQNESAKLPVWEIRRWNFLYFYKSLFCYKCRSLSYFFSFFKNKYHFYWSSTLNFPNAVPRSDLCIQNKTRSTHCISGKANKSRVFVRPRTHLSLLYSLRQCETLWYFGNLVSLTQSIECWVAPQPWWRCCIMNNSIHRHRLHWILLAPLIHYNRLKRKDSYGASVMHPDVFPP